MNAIIVRPPPIVKAPTLKKYLPSSHRLFGLGMWPAPTADDAVAIHHDAERTMRKPTDERATTRGVRGWKRSSPAAPARSRIATIPRGLHTEAAAATNPMIASGTVLAAVRPRRYTATAKRARTMGPTP